MPINAICVITGEESVSGAATFVQEKPNSELIIKGEIKGLSPGLHGLHIHEFGDTTNGCTSAGPHFNPENKSHGSPDDENRHAGDLGNICANTSGVAAFEIKDKMLSLCGPMSIIGRTLVEDGRERMLDEEEGKVVDIEDIEEDVPRSILKKRHRNKGSLCRRICNYLRSAWTGVKFSLEAEAEEGEPVPPRARPDSLKSLTRATRFTEQELKRIYRGFKAECPSGLVREDTFRSIYSQFFPQGANSSQYATYVFHTLDQANSGTLSFQDLVRGLSVLCRGSVEERLKWTFTLYDINKDGKITRDELADVITSVYSLLGRLSPLHGDEENDPLSIKIDVIFQRLDQNKDGVVTWEEFFEACTNDETITSSMAVFDSAI